MDAPLELASISGQNAQVCDAAVHLGVRRSRRGADLLTHGTMRETAISHFWDAPRKPNRGGTSAVGVVNVAGSR